MAINKVFEVALELKRPTAHRDFTVINGDNGNKLIISLTDDDVPLDLTGCRVIAAFAKADGTASIQDSGNENGGVAIDEGSPDRVTIDLFPASFCPGLVECELQIYSDMLLSTLVTTARFNFTCRKAIINEDTLESSSEMPLLRELSDEMEKQMETLKRLSDELDVIAAESSALLNSLSEMNAQAETLAPGEDACAELVHRGGEHRLQLGIPEGRRGEKGDKGDPGVVLELDSGLFAMHVDNSGDLILTVPDGGEIPPLSISDEGDLIYTIS